MEPISLVGTGPTAVLSIAPQQAQVLEQGAPITNDASLQILASLAGINNVKPEPLSTSPTPSEETEDQEDSNDALNPSALLRQINQLGPSERCSPIQAGNMGKKLLTIIAYHEQNNVSLPEELQSSFDILHRCLAVIYGTFFLNLYTKANAPCLLCHSCKCLYPPGQFIHHTCASLPPNIVPCRSRMWRRCLVPLVSPGMDKELQKQRWKFVLEKFSHNAAIACRKNPISPETEAQLLDIPELKKRRLSKPQRASEEDPKADGAGDLSVLDLEGTDDSLDAGSPVEAVQSQSQQAQQSSPLALAEQLVMEIKRLQKELILVKGKLQTASDIIGKMPSEACMREQLSQALTNQQSLTVERDQAREQARIATERADRLQRQLDLIRQTHSQMEKQFSA